MFQAVAGDTAKYIENIAYMMYVEFDSQQI